MVYPSLHIPLWVTPSSGSSGAVLPGRDPCRNKRLCILARLPAALTGHRAEPPWRLHAYSPRLTGCQSPAGHSLVLFSCLLFGTNMFPINRSFQKIKSKAYDLV